ncbi:MAG: porin, partial [Rhodovibrionaceae bacterium]|nr:porin [Rhodovibrionaceae bacterium]
MKKLLYGTTALIGTSLIAASAAQAQEGFEVSLSGFMNAYQGFTDVDETDGTDQNPFTFYHDSTINFTASQTLDNGIEAGLRFELESFGHPADEQWLWLRGSFGSFEMGWTNSAGYRMKEVGPFGPGVPINTGWVSAFVPIPSTFGVGGFLNFRSVQTGTYVDTHNDAYTISYFSPRFAGFQVGASFTPGLSGKGPIGAATVGNSANGTAQSHIATLQF